VVAFAVEPNTGNTNSKLKVTTVTVLVFL